MFISLLALIFPIAVYCLALYALNRRPLPTMINGGWDCAGMLLAGSGFYLVVVPWILGEVYHGTLYAWLFAEEGQGSAEQIAQGMQLVWAIWLGIVVAGSALLIWLRRPFTTIYNVDTEILPHVLSGVLSGLNLSQSSRGDRMRITPASSPVAAPGQVPKVGAAVQAISTAEGERSAEVVVRRFAGLCNVELQWKSSSPGLRAEVEDRLNSNLERARTYENTAAAWFLGVAGVLFGMLLMMVFVLILVEVLPSRRG